MLREIRKRMIMIKNRMPFDSDIKSYFADVEKMDWLHANLRLEGSSLSNVQIDEIVRGNVMVNASLEEHLMVHNLERLLEKLYNSYDMRRGLGARLLEEMYVLMYGSDETTYRKRNIICYQWDYTPPHPAEISECMLALNQLFDRAMEAEGEREECFEYAERIHNSIIALQPFRDGNGIIARAAMAYYLMIKGYPVVVTQMKEEDYNMMIAETLKTGELQGFCEDAKKEILKRMKLMIQLTAH